MLTPTDLERLLTVAAERAPWEMCGLMFEGHPFVECDNVAADQLHGFEIAYEEYLRQVAVHGAAPWATVHSHPHGESKISGRDMLLLDAQVAVGNTMKMIIVGLDPVEIRVYAKVDDPLTPYRCEWQWAPLPMEEKMIFFAQNS
jgi:proteasome lid subunit RPN8/RPN11